MLQYWAKLMKTIIDEYRQNRDITANFNEILFGTKYRAIFRDIYCSVVARFRRVMCDISLPVSEISLPLSEISFTLSEKSLSLSEISLSLKEKLPLNELSLPLTEKLMNMVSYVSRLSLKRGMGTGNRGMGTGNGERGTGNEESLKRGIFKSGNL